MYSLILLAAGSGSRANLGYNKLMYKINGKILLEYTLANFNDCEVILVVNKQDYEVLKQKFTNYKLVIGGETRQQSVVNGVQVASHDKVLIHDGARPFVTTEIINNCLIGLDSYDSVVPVVKIKDSIKNSDGSNVLRDNLLIAQTPQGVWKDKYLQSDFTNEYSDDVSVMEASGYTVGLVAGDYCNFKVTTSQDLDYASYLLLKS